jgi:acyl-CoA thioester hydrolase
VSFAVDFDVRYGEVDAQGVVFNAHYLAYVDHCIDRWLRSLDALTPDGDWDIMVKKATVEWFGSAGIGDVLTLVPHVSRWGNTSFDITIEGSVGERPVFRSEVTYVGVRTGTKEPVPTPERVKALLSR